MKKTTRILSIILFSFVVASSASSQILRGYVFQYTVSGDSLPLAGVRIQIDNQLLRTQSKADGSFALFLHGLSEGDTVRIVVEKKGWQCLNDTVLKTPFVIENGLTLPTIFLCEPTDFQGLKTPFALQQYIQKVYYRRWFLLHRDWQLFSRSHALSDAKLNYITEQKAFLAKCKQFLLDHTTAFSQLLVDDKTAIKDKKIADMMAFLQQGKVGDAAKIINKEQYKKLKSNHLEYTPHDNQRGAELCLLAFLKAYCAMMDFNMPLADYYFNESLQSLSAAENLNLAFYDAYISFLMAFGDTQKVFETIQTLLHKAKNGSNTVQQDSHREGVALAYYQLQEFYFKKKLYDFSIKAGQNALIHFDSLATIDPNNIYLARRKQVLHQLATVYALQNALPLAVKMGERALLSRPHAAEDRVIRQLLAKTYQTLYEQTGLTENRQKALFQLSAMQSSFEKADTTHPSVKAAFEAYKSFSFYAENIQKPRFFAKKQEIVKLEALLKQYKNPSQTVFYRSQIIEQLQKLNAIVSPKSDYLTQELAQYYREQALAQVELKNFREVESNAQKALALDSSDDTLKALLATAQWLQNKKHIAQETFNSVKDGQIIVKTVKDFEQKGIQKGAFDTVRLGFVSRRTEL